MNILMTGHHSLGNRGCEAILRSTVAAVGTRFPKARFWVPSSNTAADAEQWPEAAASGVTFIDPPRSSTLMRAWARSCRMAPFIASAPWPVAQPPQSWEAIVPHVDLMMVIGGDNYTLDYGLESLGLHVGLSTWAMRHSRPVVLWGASVGPFEAKDLCGAAIRKSMTRHLGQLQGITARESMSKAHTQMLLEENPTHHRRADGLAVTHVTDPAFNLAPQAVNLEPFWPKGTAPVLGLNVSPHVLREGGRQPSARGSVPSLDVDAIAQFIRQRCERGEYRVVCIPHVSARNGAGNPVHSIAPKWDDDVLLDALMSRLEGVPGIGRIPAWDAPRLKYAISQCDLFIGARTHSVIAALSSGIPTVALAYSMKAHGIHRDLFGHEQGVLAREELTLPALNHALDQLAQRAAQEKAFILSALPSWRARALQAVDTLPEPNSRFEVSTSQAS